MSTADQPAVTGCVPSAPSSSDGSVRPSATTPTSTGDAPSPAPPSPASSTSALSVQSTSTNATAVSAQSSAGDRSAATTSADAHNDDVVVIAAAQRAELTASSAAATRTKEVLGGLLGDVFNRADKNDDGQLSLQEFLSYFSDRILHPLEVQEMFARIDADQSHSISLDELLSYFAPSFTQLHTAFRTLEDMHRNTHEVLVEAARTYADKSAFDQFNIRFYLKELLQQLHAIYRQVDVALDNLDAQTLAKHGPQALSPEGSPRAAFADYDVVPPHSAAAASAAAASAHDVLALREQVDRLASLVNALGASRLELQLPEEEDGPGDFVTLVERKVWVPPAVSEQYLTVLRHYLTCTRRDPGCLHTWVRQQQLRDGLIVHLFVVWESRGHLAVHYQQPHHKDYQVSAIQLLTHPEELRTLELPESWFVY